MYMRFVATSVTMSERRTGEPVVVLCDISLKCCEEICVEIWRAETGGEDKSFAPKDDKEGCLETNGHVKIWRAETGGEDKGFAPKDDKEGCLET